MVIINDDEEAIRLCQQGNSQGLTVLIHRYQLRAIRIVYLLLNNNSVAEDIVQESFFRAWNSIKQFNAQQPFAPWFLRIVINTTRMYQRTLTRHPQMSLEMVDAQDSIFMAESITFDPAAQAEESEIRVILVTLIMKLSPKQREAIILHYYGGYTAPDIARIVGCRADAVRQRLHNGITTLERIMNAEYPWLKHVYFYETEYVPHDTTTPK